MGLAVSEKYIQRRVPMSREKTIVPETRNRDGTPLVRIEVMGPHGYGEVKLWMREWMRLPRAKYP